MEHNGVRLTWEQRLIIALLCISAVIYAIKFLVFGDNGESSTPPTYSTALNSCQSTSSSSPSSLTSCLPCGPKKHQEKMKMGVDLFHLSEELGSRSDIPAIPTTDIAHLAGDINRVYR